MVLTEEDKNSYRRLMRKPISLWIVIPCYVALTAAISAAKAYLDWSWVVLIEDLPFMILAIFTLVYVLVTPYQKLLEKLASSHPELVENASLKATSNGI